MTSADAHACISLWRYSPTRRTAIFLVGVAVYYVSSHISSWEHGTDMRTPHRIHFIMEQMPVRGQVLSERKSYGRSKGPQVPNTVLTTTHILHRTCGTCYMVPIHPSSGDRQNCPTPPPKMRRTTIHTEHTTKYLPQ